MSACLGGLTSLYLVFCKLGAYHTFTSLLAFSESLEFLSCLAIIWNSLSTPLFNNNDDEDDGDNVAISS